MGKRYQVFVSSTYEDLIEERKEVTKAILECDCFPAGMELFPASTQKQWDIIKKVIDSSDFYLVIIAGRYGSIGTDDFGQKISYTEMEFNYALSKDKPIIALIHYNIDDLPSKYVDASRKKQAHLKKFINKAQQGRMVRFWHNKDELHSEVLRALIKSISIAPENCGWIKLSDIDLSSDSTDKVFDSKSQPKQTSHEHKDDVETIISNLLSFSTIIEKLEYISSLNYWTTYDLFKSPAFIKQYITYVQSTNEYDEIEKAISVIPNNRGAEDNIREHIYEYNTIIYDFQNLYDKYKKGTDNRFLLAIQLLTTLSVREEKYSNTIIDIFKKDVNNLYIHPIIYGYIRMFIGLCLDSSQTVDELISFIRGKINDMKFNKIHNKLVSILIHNVHGGLENITWLHELYFSSDNTIRHYIFYNITQIIDRDVLIISPKEHRLITDIFKDIYSWNNDDATCNLLLYCLFTRTDDMYTANEIYEFLYKVNDDVFYMFIYELTYHEFCFEFMEKSYRLNSDDIEKLKSIVIQRNHPRSEKLLEFLSNIEI